MRSTWGSRVITAGQLGQRAAAAGDDVEHLQAGEHAVAGGGQVAEDDVARLLTAERPAALLQRLEHVAVADRVSTHLDPVLGHRQPEPEVGHDRDDDGVADEQAPFAPVERAHRDELVAVDQPAVVVDGEHAVGVAVEGQPELRARGDDLAAGDPRDASSRSPR